MNQATTHTTLRDQLYINRFKMQHIPSLVLSRPGVSGLHTTLPLEHVSASLSKRAFDLLFAGAAFLALFPVLLLIALLIKLDSRGPLFYKPFRKGKNGVKFSCYKFRTMYTDLCDDPRTGNRSTQVNDPRITRIGKYLRKYSLDELPQLINVLQGNMSIVGPRPQRIALEETLEKEIPAYGMRYLVKPGITGWAQANGWRGPLQTEEQKQQRIQHDLWYIHNWTFIVDMKIILKTVLDKKVRQAAY